MSLLLRPLLRACCLIATCVAVSGQWVREANQTLALPADLGSTYVLEDALGGLTFTSPTCITAPPGESNRLFVVERGVQGNPQGPTGSNTEFNPQLLTHANSRPAQIVLVENLNTTPRRQATPFLRLQDVPGMFSAGESGLYQKNESGLLSMAFHPLYAQNGYFFVFYSLSRNVGTASAPNWRLFQRISRFRASGNAPYTAATTADPTSEVPLISQWDEMANHNGGDMAFGPDGYLYIALGDEGNFFGSFANGIYINRDFFSAILRIDVDQRAGNLPPNPHSQPIAGALQNPFPSAVHAGTYRIPAGNDANPFIGMTQWHGQPIAPETVRTEFFAAGMRNPYRMSFDPATGRLFCGDVGERRREEVDLIVKGGDYGWWWKEGSIPQEAPDINHAPPDEAPSPPILSPVKPSPFTPAEIGYTEESYTDPIYEYAHLGKYGEARNCIIGGEVARGSGLAELYGKYLFADYVTGEIAALTETGGVWTRQTLMTGYPNITEFGRDPRTGDALLVNHVSGTVSRIARGTQVSAPPARLSETGAFANLPLSGGSAATRAGTPLTPHAGLVGYAPNVPFWSDYAIKQRWFALTNLTDTVGFSADGAWTLPTGMVWVKHFDLDVVRGDPTSRRKLETRFLVKTATDVYGLTYRWREDQTDADLVPESGLSEVLAGSVPAQTWRFPSRSECRACHTAPGGFALSFNTRQLNRSHPFGGQTLNQISALSAAGYFDRPVSGVESLPALAPAGDTSQSLESRVRSYLAANCVQCHQPGGAARGNWDARPGTPTGEAGLINGALLNPGDNPLNRFLVPGNPGASMVLQRLRGEGMTRMPPLGTFERDFAAEQLLTDWINSPELVPSVPNLHAPQITPVSNQTVDEGVPLTVTLTRSDADVPAQTLSYGLVSGPPGMTVTPGGVVSWTPNETQGGATVTVTVQVTDSGVPPLSATRSFQVTVRDVPQLGRTVWQLGVDAPTGSSGTVSSAEFSLENSVNDPAPGRVTRLPGDPLYVDAASNPSADDDFYFGGVYPVGFNRLTSVLSVPNDEPFSAWERAHTLGDRTNRMHFLLGSVQAAGATQYRLRVDLATGGSRIGSVVQPGFSEHDYVVRFRNGAGVTTQLYSSRLTQATNLLIDFSAAQVAATLGGNSVELVRVGPTIATDYWLIYDQVRLEVVAGNTAPQINAVPPQTVDEGTPLAVTLTGSDADLTAQTLSYGLVSGPPGMTVTPGGVVSWTPNETQGGATVSVTVQVTDNGVPPLSATQSFQVTVRDVPQLGRTVWQLGVDSPSSAPGSAQSAEFSVENGLNDLAPGRVTRLPEDPHYGNDTSNPKADDDYYFGGVYPAGFNRLGSLLRVPNDEPFNAWERALTQSDRTNRLHFLLGSAQVAGGTQYRLRTDIAAGGWMMGTSVQPGFGEHDHVVRFRNGAGVATIVCSHRLTRSTNFVVDFTAAQVAATLGANSLELVRPGPLTAAASWLVYDQLRLEVVSSGGPGGSSNEPIYLKPSGFANTGTLAHGQVSLEGIRYLTLTYGRPAPLPMGANYRIEMSSNLVHWTTADVVVVSDPVLDGWETVTVRDRTPLDQGSPRFLRVHVEPATPQ